MLGPPPNIFCWCWCWCCFKAAFLARCCGESESESDSGSCAPTGLNRDRLIAPAPGPCGKLLFRSGGPMKPMMRFCSLLGVAAPLRCAGELPTLGTLPQFCVCERAASALRPVSDSHQHTCPRASTRRQRRPDVEGSLAGPLSARSARGSRRCTCVRCTSSSGAGERHRRRPCPVLGKPTRILRQNSPPSNSPSVDLPKIKCTAVRVYRAHVRLLHVSRRSVQGRGDRPPRSAKSEHPPTRITHRMKKRFTTRESACFHPRHGSGTQTSLRAIQSTKQR